MRKNSYDENDKNSDQFPYLDSERTQKSISQQMSIISEPNSSRQLLNEEKLTFGNITEDNLF